MIDSCNSFAVGVGLHENQFTMHFVQLRTYTPNNASLAAIYAQR